MRAKHLFTIGYEGSDLDDFLTTLAACGVEQIIDIRDVPLSRKRGFSKKTLANALAATNITYVHIKQLGDPKPGREAARRGDFAAFRKIYRQHLKGSDAQAALKVAARMASGTPSCLLCFERVPEHCHRTIVAKALVEQAGFAIAHLEVRKNAVSHHKRDDDRSSVRELALR